MLRRHAFPLILVAAASTLAACSPSGSGNITATDNDTAAAPTNDVVANDEAAVPEDGAVGNALLSDNASVPDTANVN